MSPVASGWVSGGGLAFVGGNGCAAPGCWEDSHVAVCGVQVQPGSGATGEGEEDPGYLPGVCAGGRALEHPADRAVSEPDLSEWTALRRVHDGRVTKSAGVLL